MALAVVKLLQVREYMLLREVSSRVFRAVTLFSLEVGEERFDDRVVEAVPLSAHAARHLHALQGMLVAPARVLGGFKWSSQHLKKEVVMSTGKRKSERAGRRKMRSPGRPQAGRSEHRRRFWKAIAAGLTSEAAGIDAGVSPAVGSRWFREAGGMPSTTLAPWSEAPSGRYLSFTEREEIALCRAQSVGIREIARRLIRIPVK